MAMVSASSRCAICGGRLDRPYTATSGVPFNGPPRLAAYYDAPLHWDCLPTWPERAEFSRAYFVSGLWSYWSGHGTLLRAMPDWFLACGPPASDGDPRYAEIRLPEWPFRLYSDWHDWDEFVDGGFRRKLPLGPALDAAEAVMSQVRRTVPTLAALAALRDRCWQPALERQSLVEFGDYLTALWGEAARRTNWRALEQKRQHEEDARAQQERERAKAIVESNEIARRLALQLKTAGGLRCPHCRQRTRDMRFHDREPHDKSYFVCRLCGRSFAGSEAVEDI